MLFCLSAAPAARATSRLTRGALLGLSAAALLISGCATPLPHVSSVISAQAPLTASYQGRFAVRYADQYAHVENVYGNFTWDEQADTVMLALQNPLGNTLAIVSAMPDRATLQLPGKPVQTAPGVEALMQRSLGFPMPVSGLRYWLMDQVSPASHATTVRDAQGRITQIEQDGWRIDILAFGDGDGQSKRVRRMNLTRLQMPDDAPLEVKLVINL